MTHLILILLLGSNSFQIREAAQLALENDPSCIMAVWDSQQHKDPEIAMRCQRILIHNSEYRSILEKWQFYCFLQEFKAEALRSFPAMRLPYIDALPPEVEDRWDLISRYRAAGFNFPEFFIAPYESDRGATAAWLFDELNRGKTKEDLLPILNKMQERSNYYDQHKCFPD